ncbi:MAG: hypothetical protein KDA96_04080 [Planctomycetaceae bacterium]|nr:hypothetical protein [Planctomycetaceae bacterium]
MYKTILVVTVMFVLVHGGMVRGEDDVANEPKPTCWPVAAACLHECDPGEMLEQLEDFAQLVGGKPSAYWDLKKQIERRFVADEHLPFPKGLGLFFGPEGMSRVDFEYVVDLTGAEAAIAEYSSQWIAAVPRKHPIYEVDLKKNGDADWTVEVHSLFWMPVLPDDLKEEITYTKKRQGISIRTSFHFEDGVLWSASGSESLTNHRFDLLPRTMVEPAPRQNGRRLASVWLNPQHVPQELREQWLAAMESTAFTQLQPQNEEASDSVATRQRSGFLRILLMRTFLLDVQDSHFFLDSSEGNLGFRGSLQLSEGSVASQWLSEMRPVYSCQKRLPPSVPIQSVIRGTRSESDDRYLQR